MDSGV